MVCCTNGGFKILRENHFKRNDFDECIWFYYLDESNEYTKGVLESNFETLRAKYFAGDILEIKVMQEFHDQRFAIGGFPEYLSEMLYSIGRYNTHPILANQLMVKLCIDRMSRIGMYDVVCATATNDLPEHLFVFKVIEMMKMCGMQPLAEDLVEYVGIGKWFN